MKCGMKLVRYQLLIFNVILGLAGLVMLVTGVLIELRAGNVGHFHRGKFHGLPFLLIVIGSAVVIASLFGGFGALFKNYLLVIIYGGLLLTIFALEVVCAGLAFAYRSDWRELSDKKIKNAIENYDSNKEKVDDLQETAECCGFTDHSDYRRDDLPSSCCSSGKGSCTPVSEDLYTRGCKEALREFIRKSGVIIGTVGISLCVLEMVGIVFTFYMARAILEEMPPHYL